MLRDLITLNAKDYLSVSTDIYINIIMLIIASALSIACFFINYHKTYTVNMIKQLLRREATSEESAKTLFDLHLERSAGLRLALTRKGQLTGIVCRAGYVEPTYDEYISLSKEKKLKKEKIDFTKARFFIPKENVDRAKLIKEKENPTILRTALVCVFIFAVTVCLMLLMPEILNFISNVKD